MKYTRAIIGERNPLRRRPRSQLTRSSSALIDAIHDGSLAKAQFSPSPIFNLAVPNEIPGSDVPTSLLNPVEAWSDPAAFEAQNKKLAAMFNTAFERYAADCSPEVCAAGPKI